MRSRYFYTIIILLIVLSPSLLSSRENSTDLYKKGADFAENGKLDDAIKTFKQVIVKSPYYCLGHYGLGRAYLYKSGRLDEAVKHLRISVKLDRKLAKGYFYLGMAYFLSKKYTHAIHAFMKSYENDDRYIEALYNIGVIYDMMNQTYKSRVFYKRYIAEKLKTDEDLVF